MDHRQVEVRHEDPLQEDRQDYVDRVRDERQDYADKVRDERAPSKTVAELNAVGEVPVALDEVGVCSRCEEEVAAEIEVPAKAETPGEDLRPGAR